MVACMKELYRTKTGEERISDCRDDMGNLHVLPYVYE
jgi:hypothetical protein